MKLPAAPLKRDLRFAPTSCRESSKCKVFIPFYCSSLANPAAPATGFPLRSNKLRGMRSLKHFQYHSTMFIAGNFVYIWASIFFVKGNIPAVVASPPPGFDSFLPAPTLSSAINKTLEFLAPAGVSKLSQGLGFDLPDALPGYQKILAHLL